MTQIGFIYGLECPFSHIIFYIGQSVDCDERLRHHYNSLQKKIRKNKNLNEKEKKLLKLKLVGRKPIIRILDTGECGVELKEKEQNLISKHPKLLNHLRNVGKVENKKELSKSVLVYDKTGILKHIFCSIQETSRLLNVGYSSISRSCRNPRKFYISKGYYFKFQTNKNIRKTIKIEEKLLPVYVYNKNGVFVEKILSLSKVVEKYKISMAQVSMCFNGRIQFAGEFIFKKIYVPKLPPIRKKQINKKCFVYDKINNTTTEFASIREAGRNIGKGDTIRNHLLSQNRLPISGRYVCYFDGEDIGRILSNEIKSRKIHKINGSGEKVAFYNSIKEAVEKEKISRQTFTRLLKNPDKSVNGFYYRTDELYYRAK